MRCKGCLKTKKRCKALDLKLPIPVSFEYTVELKTDDGSFANIDTSATRPVQLRA
jgi:hypothetical protein